MGREGAAYLVGSRSGAEVEWRRRQGGGAVARPVAALAEIRQPNGVGLKRTGAFGLGIFQGGAAFIWATSLQTVGIENRL
jgi:hypothetical protein